jgi:hypothetical protein
MELIYYIRKPDSRVVVQEQKEKDSVTPTGEKGWYRDERISLVKLSRGVPYAVVVSNGYNSVGWAVCSHGDSFNKKRGLMIARAREANGFNMSHVPEFMVEHLNIMLEKSRRVFGN